MDDHSPISDEEAYIHAFVMSVFNGLLSVLLIQAKRGLVTPAELAALHSSMSKPLGMAQLSGNTLVADLQQRLDGLLGEAARFLKEGPLPPEEEPRRRDE